MMSAMDSLGTAVTFKRNFTSSLIRRTSFFSFLDELDDDAIEKDSLVAAMDMTNSVISSDVRSQIIKALKVSVSDLDDICHILGPLKDSPLQFKMPVYGVDSGSNQDSVVPGLTVAMSFYFPLIATLSAFLPERLQASLERSLVTGANVAEVIMSHFLTQILSVIVQVGGTILASYELLGAYMIGDYGTFTMLTAPVAVSEMIYGFIIASVSPSETLAVILGLVSTPACVTGSGMLWPVEGAVRGLREVFWILPTDASTNALRNVAQKGWSIANIPVQLALLSSLAWDIILLIVLVSVWKLRR